ncbi:MAG: hypothetical protein ABSG59_24795 [Verrucomicrobiota bacterium]
MIHRICRSVERWRARDQSLERAVGWFASYWRDRKYTCEPARPIRLSAKSLVRLFYQWRAGGKTPAAVGLHYRPGLQKLTPPAVIELARLCLLPGANSFNATWKQLPNPGATASAYRYAMPVELRRHLKAVFAARRALQSTERAAREAIEQASVTFRR